MRRLRVKGWVCSRCGRVNRLRDVLCTCGASESERRAKQWRWCDDCERVRKFAETDTGLWECCVCGGVQ